MTRLSKVLSIFREGHCRVGRPGSASSLKGLDYYLLGDLNYYLEPMVSGLITLPEVLSYGNRSK